VEELCIWKDVLMNFERCWTRYNKNNKLKKDIKSIRIANKKLCNKAKENLNENTVSPKSMINQNSSATHFHVPEIDDIIKPIEKTIENIYNTSIKNRRSKSLFTEVTG